MPWIRWGLGGILVTWFLMVRIMGLYFLSIGGWDCLRILIDLLAVERNVVIKVVVDLYAPHTVIWYVNNF